jgi:hypothetical protein
MQENLIGRLLDLKFKTKSETLLRRVSSKDKVVSASNVLMKMLLRYARSADLPQTRGLLKTCKHHASTIVPRRTQMHHKTRL